MNTERRRVLSIQSHVVHGYVGNKSATFPLQVLGFEVDAINSVQFSNHTGYATIKGQILNEKELADVFYGLEANQLLQHYSHLLTGYIGSVSFLREVANIVKKLRQINSQFIYVCDPVMGDDGRMYVPEELLPIFRDEIIPLADIVTPNQYEVERLTETKINTDADMWQAVQWFHDRGVDVVAISSSDLAQATGELKAFLSKRNGPRYTLNMPKQGEKVTTFTGTGDLFAALFLAHSYGTQDYGNALELTIATLQAIIIRTMEAIPVEVLSGKRKITAQERELKLVQSKLDIEQPTVLLKAQLIN